MLFSHLLSALSTDEAELWGQTNRKWFIYIVFPGLQDQFLANALDELFGKIYSIYLVTFSYESPKHQHPNTSEKNIHAVRTDSLPQSVRVLNSTDTSTANVPNHSRLQINWSNNSIDSLHWHGLGFGRPIWSFQGWAWDNGTSYSSFKGSDLSSTPYKVSSFHQYTFFQLMNIFQLASGAALW